MLTKIEIKGFRSFGNEPQHLDLSPKVNFIWAGNSQGKTSFTEGMEFLLTGNISRRDLLASSKDEFADALKNGFLSENDEVYVEIEIKKTTSSHKIRRILIQDFGKRNDCSSKLFIDGKESTEADLANLGFTFNFPPLSTPILMQHCLSYLLTARPQDRAEFFKAVFEVNDVEMFRNSVEQAINAFNFQKLQI
jgi:chromosome segregation ATPase